MTSEPEGLCCVCNERVNDIPHVILGPFVVGNEDEDCILHEPDVPIEDAEEWDDGVGWPVCLSCVQTYFDGMHAELRMQQRQRGKQ